MSLDSLTFLRRTLTLDAVISGVSALVFLMAGNTLSAALDIPATLLRWAGAALVPFVLFVAYVARQRDFSHGAVWTIIALNAAWVVASIWLVTGGAVEPNGWGKAVIVVQALAVGVFAELQYLGLRRVAPSRAIS